MPRADSQCRSNRRRWAIVCTFALGMWALSTSNGLADERIVVRFNVAGPTIDAVTSSRWVDRLTFHNGTTNSATIQLLGVSNGATSPLASSLIVPAGSTVSVRSDVDTVSWTPSPEVPLWVVRLDVPPGVVMESRLELAASHVGGSFPFPDKRTLSAFPLPVYSATATGSSIFLGTDLGADENGFATNARINVIVYNGGTGVGHSIVETHRACDDSVIESRSTTVSPNTAIQVQGLSTNTEGCSQADNTSGSYVVATMDQPNLAWQTTLSNQELPIMPVGVSFTY